MKIKISLTLNRHEEIEVKELSCKVEDVVYCKRDKEYCAYDFATGLKIGSALKVSELINLVNSRLEDIKTCRANPDYSKEIINKKENLFTLGDI